VDKCEPLPSGGGEDVEEDDDDEDREGVYRATR
jgi:hypothetical protein